MVKIVEQVGIGHCVSLLTCMEEGGWGYLLPLLLYSHPWGYPGGGRLWGVWVCGLGGLGCGVCEDCFALCNLGMDVSALKRSGVDDKLLAFR